MPHGSTIPELAWLDVQLTKTGLWIFTYVHCVYHEKVEQDSPNK